MPQHILVRYSPALANPIRFVAAVKGSVLKNRFAKLSANIVRYPAQLHMVAYLVAVFLAVLE